MYDEEGNLINQEDVTTDTWEEGDQEEGWYVKLSKEEHEALLNKARRADVLKAKSAKYSQEKRNNPNNSEVLEKLQREIEEMKTEKLATQVKSIYADADVAKVQEFVQRWLTVEQATRALYGEEMLVKTATNVWIAWRAGGGESLSNEVKESVNMANRMLGL